MTAYPSLARCACHGSSCSPGSLPTPVALNSGCQSLPPQPATTARSAALLAQIDQHRAARDTIALLDMDCLHGGVIRRAERRLHLHRLEYDERLAGFDC